MKKKKSLIITIILYYSNTRAPVMIDKYTEKHCPEEAHEII